MRVANPGNVTSTNPSEHASTARACVTNANPRLDFTKHTFEDSKTFPVSRAWTWILPEPTDTTSPDGAIATIRFQDCVSEVQASRSEPAGISPTISTADAESAAGGAGDAVGAARPLGAAFDGLLFAQPRPTKEVAIHSTARR